MKVKEIMEQKNKCSVALKEIGLALSVNEVEKVSIPRERMIDIYDLIARYEEILSKVIENTEVGFYGY